MQVQMKYKRKGFVRESSDNITVMKNIKLKLFNIPAAMISA